MTNNSDLKEKIARALCWSNGCDPDVTLGGDGVNFLWMEYEHQAEAVMDVINGEQIFQYVPEKNCWVVSPPKMEELD